MSQDRAWTPWPESPRGRGAWRRARDARHDITGAEKVAIALVALLAGAAALVAVVVTRRGGDRPPRVEPQAQVAGAGGVVVPLPTGWQPAKPSPAVAAAIGLQGSIAASPDWSTEAGLLLGRAPRAAPGTLLPRGVATARHRTRVALGGSVAWRYDGAQVGRLSDQIVTAYAVPAVRGAPLVALCHGPAVIADVLLSECESVVGGARLPAGALDPDPAYARSLAAPLGRLAASANRLAARTSGSGPPAPRVAPARALAAAYAGAARQLSEIRPTPGARAAHAALGHELARLGDAYGALARALAAGRPDLVGSAMASAAVARKGAARARAALVALGYPPPARK